MSSGSYFPPPVKAVEIPKPQVAGVRVLGVPTVADRVAQTVVARSWRRRWNRSSIRTPTGTGRAVGAGCGGGLPGAVLEQRLGDRFGHPEVLRHRAVGPGGQGGGGAHRRRWVVLYVRRWLAAPLQLPDGSLAERDRGTPQGSAMSPVLANLFMHYAFDAWMVREYPGSGSNVTLTTRWSIAAAGAGARCWPAIGDRMAEVGLELHPDKTRIVYCKDNNRRDVRGHRVHVPGVHLPAREARARTGWVHRVPARDQQGSPEEGRVRRCGPGG